MIHKKLFSYSIYAIAAAIFIYSLLYLYINYVYVPKKIAPMVYAYVNSDPFKPLEVSVSEVAFHPFRGFVLRDLLVESPTVLKGKDLLSARLVDVDIAFLPLLWKKVHIKRLRVIGANLTIGRDTEGVWNFSHIKDLYYSQSSSGFNIVINEMWLPRCNMVYMDYFKKANCIEREFDNIRVKLKRYTSSIYRATISGSDKDRARESISLTLSYDAAANSVKGKARLATTYINDYWEYYLDEALKPWSVTCEAARLDTSFSFVDNVCTLDGSYLIDKAVLSYGEVAISADIVIGHEVTYFSNSANSTQSHIEARLKDVYSLLGNYRLLDKGKCYILIDKDQVRIEEIRGSVRGQPVELTGKFIFGNKRELTLRGTIADIRHDFSLILPTYTYGRAYWGLKKDDSFININADMQDLEDSLFNLHIIGDINMPDLSKLLKIDREDLLGGINFSGRLTGEADDLDSLQGKLAVDVKNLSLFKLQPLSFNLDMKAKDGIF
ncbi:MAG: AsmA family protein, partial [Candidatus Orphnella occulta]|nr:AsmA family protein [Candidatus Orphnella occulta]